LQLLSGAIRLDLIALHAVELCAYELRSPLFAIHPRTVLPRRIVAHVARVAALEIGHPVTLLVPMESDDRTFHGAA
jgi:hypothetical protein